MHHDDLSSPTGQQLNILSSGSRTTPVEKDVTHQAQPPHHLQQAPYLQFEGQKDQQVPWFSFSLYVVHASLAVTLPQCAVGLLKGPLMVHRFRLGLCDFSH